jgi:hypothetical protein
VVEPTSPGSVVVRFETTEPARVRVAYGIDGEPPTLWLRETEPATAHALGLEGTVFTRAYRIRLQLTGATRNDDRELVVPPRALTAAPQATTAGGVLLLDGHAFFPLMSWAQCPDTMEQGVAAGINLFLHDPCGGVQEQVATLRGRGLVAGMADDTASGAGHIGYAYPDEPDGLGITAETLAPAAAAAPGRVAFMTLTNHFYLGADPLPAGRGIYPGLVARADVVGFDLYPLQEWCKRDRLVDVAAAQRELVQLALGKPTYQWIEAATWKCPAPETAVTRQTVRAETLLALTGGARGIGFFPPTWDASIHPEVTSLTRTLDAIAPALLRPQIPVSAPLELKVAAYAFEDALYIVAVNPGSVPIRGRIAVPGLGGRTLTVLGVGRTARARQDALTETFPPLAARIYVAAP